MFLQSCLALKDYKIPNRFWIAAAIGVVGSSTRTYFGLAAGRSRWRFFNALAYEGADAGRARCGRRRTSCSPTPCSRRNGSDEQRARTGANSRAAWAFTPCGASPTFRLPKAGRQTAGALSAGQAWRDRRRHSSSSCPPKLHGKVATSKYQVRMPPQLELAGAGAQDQRKTSSRWCRSSSRGASAEGKSTGQSAQLLKANADQTTGFYYLDQLAPEHRLPAGRATRRRWEFNLQVEWSGASVGGRE